MFVRVKVYYKKCPDCGSTWSAQLSQQEVIRLGKEFYVCKCKKQWPTGHAEWANLTAEQRKEYFFSTAEAGVLLLWTVSPALFGYFIGSGWGSAVNAGAWGFLFGVVWIGFLWLVKMTFVKLSLRRCPHPVLDVRGGWPWNW